MNISNSMSQIINSIQSSHSEHIFLQTLLYPISHQLELKGPVLDNYRLGLSDRVHKKSQRDLDNV